MTEAALLELLGRSRELGFLGPGPVERHVAHAAAFEAATPPPPSFLDLGSGGGVPGLVLALAWPEARGTLVDAQARRVTFLGEALVSLGVDDRVEAVHGRAEELAHHPRHRGQYAVVTARSFAAPGITAECGAGYLVAGGRLIVSEPPEARRERWPDTGLAALGLVDDGVVVVGASRVRVLRSLAGPCDGVPRRTAVLSKRPRF